jgi:hypothetical protein
VEFLLKGRTKGKHKGCKEHKGSKRAYRKHKGCKEHKGSKRAYRKHKGSIGEHKGVDLKKPLGRGWCPRANGNRPFPGAH